MIGEVPEGGQEPEAAVELLQHVQERRDENSYLVRRVRETLDLVRRTGSAEGIEDHLKYLSELDASRAAQSYGLVRFVVWAIPIMGFLGTVIGITVAIASLSPTQLDDITGVVSGLGTAFDTTASALALSMVLMFLQFLVDRLEQSLLGKVDESQESAEALIEPFIVGETIKIVDGPFTEFVGDIQEINEDKKKLKVIVKIFGRGTEVELNFMQVEKTS